MFPVDFDSAQLFYDHPNPRPILLLASIRWSHTPGTQCSDSFARRLRSVSFLGVFLRRNDGTGMGSGAVGGKTQADGRAG